MALRDYLPWNRRQYATKGTNPPYTKDDPRSYGEGVIRRIQLQQNRGMFGAASHEPQIGDPKTYMSVYLADPIVRTLIDLPCLYAAKDGYDIVTDDDVEREAITLMFDEINLEQTLNNLDSGDIDLIDKKPRKGLAGNIAFIHPKSTYGTVSYTHLTLPTILLV